MNMESKKNWIIVGVGGYNMAVMSTKPVRGTRDILPEEMAVRDALQEKILKIYGSHGFSRIETPAMENLELLLGSDAGENLKMLFSILKRGEKLNTSNESSVTDLCDMGLRYDLTLPLSRFYADNSSTLDMPFKAIQIDNVFRAERPQKGRFRSFKQCDIDIIGDPTVAAEMELISTTAKALCAIGFQDFVIKINNRQLLTSYIEKSGFKSEDIGSICISLDKADKIGVDGVKAELVKKGYEESMVNTFVDGVSSITLDTIGNFIDESKVIEDLQKVIKVITELSKGMYKIQFDFTLIRGMGYYTGQVFEVSYGKYGYSIAGGGRYDNMIGKFTKQSVPAVGFSIGFERIVGILLEESKGQENKSTSIVLFYSEDEDFTKVSKKREELIESGYKVNLVVQKKKFGKQIKVYEDKGYLGFMVFGRDEEIRLF